MKYTAPKASFIMLDDHEQDIVAASGLHSPSVWGTKSCSCGDCFYTKDAGSDWYAYHSPDCSCHGGEDPNCLGWDP